MSPDLFSVGEYPADYSHYKITEDRSYPSLIFRTASRNHTTHIGGVRSSKFCVVNTQDGLAEMIRAIVSQREVELYVGVEASLLVLHVHQEPGCSYVVDLESLGPSAFQPCEVLDAAQKAPAKAGRPQAEPHSTSLPSLRAILESNSIPKILFDCRPACAFLAGRFGINVGSVGDIQCLELEGRLIKHEEGQQDHRRQERDLRSCLE